MKNLTINLEEEISILNKYRITSNELMLIRALLLLQDDNNEVLFKSYLESLNNCNIKLRELILSLQEKGIILKSWKIPNEGQLFDPYSIPFNKIFIKTIYKCSFELGKELFEIYPQFGSINGNVIPLRGVARHFDSLEDAYIKYGKAIRWNPEIHKEIVNLIEWSKEFNILNQSLSSFIINQAWMDLQAIKDGKDGVNYNSIKML